MKCMILVLAGLVSASTWAANIKTAEYYVLNTWMGEYPPGYQINKDVKVPSVASPENPSKNGECTLKANSVIHVWAKKTKSEFATLNGIVKYKALKNFELSASETKKIQVKVGDIVTELSYLAEGQCMMSVNGQELADSCVDASSGNVKLIATSPFPTTEYFKTTCKEGRSAWISSEKVSALINIPNSGVSGAEILEYGSVIEP